jgi:hypothetical protein
MYNTTLQLVDCIEDPNGASGIMTVVGSNTADGNNHMAIEDLTLDCNYASNVKRGFNHDTSDNSCLVLKNNVFTVLPNGYGFYLLGSRDSVIQNNIISLGGGNAVGILASGPTIWGESTRLLIQNNVIKRAGNWGGESWGMWLDKGRHISKGNHSTQPEDIEIRNNGVHASLSNELPAAVGYVNGNYGIEGPLKRFPKQPTSSSFRFSNDQCPNYP